MFRGPRFVPFPVGAVTGEHTSEYVVHPGGPSGRNRDRRVRMDVGIQMIFSTYGWPGMSDREAWQEEIHLARVADEVGFDVIWSVEHNFFDYSFCPDNTQLLSYLAPLCTHADLGTAAIILPWNDPLRIAGKVSVLG